MSEDPAYLWQGHRPRAASFENPGAAVSAGGSSAGGRKGAPMRVLAAGERVVLADVAGPGRIGHFWLTLGRAERPGVFDRPQLLRSQVLEVFYDGLDRPSMSVPVGDLFGAVHGVPTPLASRLTTINEGRGFASRIPMPFGDRVRIEYENGLNEPVILYYQIDFLLGEQPEGCGRLHATFRRENPTVPGRDFLIGAATDGPGRLLGWTGGVRVHDRERWWGEGEVKVYLDGEATPTICGTGSEDYLDSAWGLGSFSAPETGAPLVWSTRGAADGLSHSLVSLYRWHLSDPIPFHRELRVAIQQIGMAAFRTGQESDLAEFRARAHPAGHGWSENPARSIAGMSLYERSDDWCATCFFYLQQPRPVPLLDRAAALADLPGSTDSYFEVRRPSPISFLK